MAEPIQVVRWHNGGQGESMNRVALVRDLGAKFEYLTLEYPFELHEQIYKDPKTGEDERRYWKDIQCRADAAALMFQQTGWRLEPNVKQFLQDAVAQFNTEDLSDIEDLL